MKTKLMALEEVKNPISESDRGNVQNIMVLVDAYADTSVVNGIRSGWAQMARASIQAELLQQFYTTPQKPAAAEWMPIETAPKDGTPIDIWRSSNGGERCAEMRRVDLGSGNVFYEPIHSGYSCVRDATHWMQLPAAPGCAA